MLELKQIHKDYPAGNGKVRALKGVSLRFRKSEFVSILGPSGCGKTTLLNIIGGLDQYTMGDLIINGRSTKDFKDRDWDSYRNHSIGFVFQTYNLIPHQTVLQNVELALTLSGVSKAERRMRARKALEDVGLGDQFNKRPNEMSGGQMQRVAIARALVNDPDIILADEPTGALDTETSVQVMEILKRISEKRLIIMVTHNPELAQRYSTRIIRMLDGIITDDSMPVSEQEYAAWETYKPTKERKPSMSFATSFMLSLKNLFTKKGRTTLTAFAGSIGIIGIALIFAVSNGMTTYIDETQENALSSYPMSIERTTTDLSSLMSAFMDVRTGGAGHDREAVYPKVALHDIVNALSNMGQQQNDLASFKQYLTQDLAREDDDAQLSDAISGISYTYELPLLVYTKNIDGMVLRSDTTELMTDIIAEQMGSAMDMTALISMRDSSPFGAMSASSMRRMGMWQEMLPGKDGSLISDVLKKQYDIVYGAWPNDPNEIILVIDENNEIDDLTLYALGLQSKESIMEMTRASMTGQTIEATEQRWTYKEICDREYRVILNSSCYTKDETTGLYTDLRTSEAGLRYLYDSGIVLKISGIARPSEDAVATMLNGGAIGYTAELTKYVIEESQKSAAIQAQIDAPTLDVFTGLPFKENTGALTAEQKEEALRAHIAQMSEAEKADAYVRIMSIPTDEVMQAAVKQAMQGMTRERIEQAMISGIAQQAEIGMEELIKYVESMSDEDLQEFFSQMAGERIKQEYAGKVQQQLSALQPAQMAVQLEQAMNMFTPEQFGIYYDEIMEFSASSYDSNLLELGYVDINDPVTINIYASSFANKDLIEEKIAQYNEGVEELHKIKYTDYIGIMMSSITTIINAITYVLIAFVAISLVVSSIMIGVITLISVQERTKEIGILRAIGASKRDVSGMFNAETLIIGFCAGLLGVLITYLLCIPINAIITALTGIPNLNAILPISVAAVLVGISMLLTLIAGVIPSRSAAKKDPVVALRTE